MGRVSYLSVPGTGRLGQTDVPCFVHCSNQRGRSSTEGVGVMRKSSDVQCVATGDGIADFEGLQYGCIGFSSPGM